MASIFTLIVEGEIPSIKVHEDSKTLAIMDINPIQTGQILVIPKMEAATVWDLNSEDYQALMDTVQNAGRSLRNVFPDKKVGVMIEGLEVVDHAHVKVFPFSTAKEYHSIAKQADTRDLKSLATKLAF